MSRSHQRHLSRWWPLDQLTHHDEIVMTLRPSRSMLARP